MQHSIPKQCVGICVMCLLGFALTWLSLFAQTEGQHLTIRGTLLRVAATGGESTGWAIRLDKELTIEGKAQSSIEAEGPLDRFPSLENKHIEASGKIIMRHGVETGERPILEITEVHELR